MQPWYFGFWEKNEFRVPVNYFGYLVDGEEASRVLYHLCKGTGKDFVLKSKEQIGELYPHLKIVEHEGK